MSPPANNSLLTTRPEPGQHRRRAKPDEEEKPKRKGKTPWKRGPAAYAVARAADDLLEEMAGMEATHLSLRETAQLLGVSTQPLRDWHRDGWLRKGPRGLKFPVEELRRFVEWLGRYAKPFDMRARLVRLRKRGEPPPRAWDKLRNRNFRWPKGQRFLRPTELAELLGCHPSLITKAIARGYLQGRKRNKVHWEIWRTDQFYFG